MRKPRLEELPGRLGIDVFPLYHEASRKSAFFAELPRKAGRGEIDRETMGDAVTPGASCKGSSTIHRPLGRGAQRAPAP